MKQKYIVGDLVRISFISDDKIFEIIEGGTINPYIAKDMDGKEAIAEEHSIIPIPITPEILQKNGWKFTKIDTSLYQYYKDDIYIKYDKLEEKFKFDDLYWSAYSFEIPYVHTLQHLLTEMEV